VDPNNPGLGSAYAGLGRTVRGCREAGDLAPLDIDLAAITQAGGWKSTDAATVCGEDQCRPIWNGEGGGEDGEGFATARRLTHRSPGQGRMAGLEP
jgi:hypothetical protein